MCCECECLFMSLSSDLSIVLFSVAVQSGEGWDAPCRCVQWPALCSGDPEERQRGEEESFRPDSCTLPARKQIESYARFVPVCFSVWMWICPVFWMQNVFYLWNAARGQIWAALARGTNIKLTLDFILLHKCFTTAANQISSYFQSDQSKHSRCILNCILSSMQNYN